MSDKSRTLLILAASIYQLDAIRAAQRLGCRVVTVDNVPTNPGHALADRSYNVDTTNLEGVLKVAQRESVSGVLAACTDVAVPTAAYVAEKLNLPGQPFHSAQILTSKVRFRQFLTENGLPVPEAISVAESFHPAPDLFRNRTWLLKPDRSSGGKGIFMIATEEEFRRRFPETLAFSSNRTAVLEAFLFGHQGTCEGILAAGQVAVAFVTDRETASAPYVTTVSHRLPSRLTENSRRRLLELVEQVFCRLGIRDAVFDCDFVAVGPEVFLLEISPRAGGNSISRLLRCAAGFDLMEFAVRQACGEQPQVPADVLVRPTAVLLLGSEEAGQLHYNAQEAAALRREEWVDSLTLDLPAGAPVQPFINGRHRVGEAVIYGVDRDDLDAKANTLRQRLDLRVV